MADYPISNVARRIVYTGSAGVGPYAFSFEVLTNTDIKVYKNDLLLTLTTDYTVTISPTLGTGSVTLVTAATGSDRITIVGARAIQRTTDFTTGGDFFANTLNDEMDSQTILVQQVAETAERGIKAPVTDPTNINMILPINTARAGKTLAFDASGNPVAGDPIGNWRGNWASGTSYQNRDIVKDSSNSNVYLVTTAHTSSGSLPISTNADSAKFALVVDATAADASADAAAVSETNAAASAILANDWATKTSGAVAGGEYSAKYHAQAASTSATNASNSATSASSAQTAAESARDATLAAYDSFDDRYLGSKTSAPTLDNDGNALVAGALYFNSVSGVMNVYTGSIWVAAYVSGTGFLATSANLSDVANTTTARTNISAAKSGANSDITSITGLITSLSVAQGGTGLTSPGTSGNVLTSNGTAWTSAALAVPSAYRLKLLLSGTTYTKPSDVKSLYAFVYGATGGTSSSTGGGGGPGYSETYYASPAASYSYAIGAAGVMATPTAGGTTSFGAMSVTSSAAVSTSTGGLGGVGSGGDFNANGGTGGNGGTNSGGLGGAGSRAGNGGNGGTGGTAFGGGGGTGGNAGTNSPTTTAQGAAATAKAAGALALPWATAGEFFDGGSAPGYLGATAITGFVVDTVSQLTRTFASASGATLFSLGAQVGGSSSTFSVPSSKGLILLVEVI